MQSLEFVTQRIWPLLAPLLGRQVRCSRCILSSRCTTLRNGLCRACLTYKPSSVRGGPALTAELRRTLAGQTKGARYDAALLLSGGKDSAYILHRMRTEHPDIRILAITIDDGYLSPFAIPNAQRCAEATMTDLLVVESEKAGLRQEIRKSFLELRGRGCYGIVDYAHGSSIFRAARKAAANLGIQTLLSGLSWVQLELVAGKESEFAFTEPSGQTMVCPLAAWKTSEPEVRQYVRDKQLMLPGSDSPLASNGRLITAMGFVDMHNLGYSSFEPEFAQLIREGKASRAYWRNVFDFFTWATNRGLLDKEVQATLAELDLTIGDVM